MSAARRARGRPRAPGPRSRRGRRCRPATSTFSLRSAFTTCGQGEVVGLELRAVDDHLDLARRLADEVDRADAAARSRAGASDDLVRDAGGGLGRERRARSTRDRDDRHRAGVDALDDRLLDLAGQVAADRRDLAAHVLRGVHASRPRAGTRRRCSRGPPARSTRCGVTPSTVLIASSIFFVTSRSTVSGRGAGVDAWSP